MERIQNGMVEEGKMDMGVNGKGGSDPVIASWVLGDEQHQTRHTQTDKMHS